ncbi:imidazole glycerol phosphate synthase subunit HisH [Candidatus Dependentiae bacterium]|nr:imidazole glycerol phosphate synthase subunit HisH [Candidatus Dependentiae bacterium]
MKISIVDYNIGNIGSVIKAFQYIGADTESINTPEQVLKSEKLVLPGVSAFGSAMDNLNKLNLTEALREYIKKGKYFLGICIGMQLLFEESSESPEVKGLKILKGKVKRFDDPKLIVPHMGWNTISINKKSVLMNKIKPDDYFYFVHSYYCCPESEKSF